MGVLLAQAWSHCKESIFVLGPELEGRKPPGMPPTSEKPLSNMHIQGVSKWKAQVNMEHQRGKQTNNKSKWNAVEF